MPTALYVNCRQVLLLGQTIIPGNCCFFVQAVQSEAAEPSSVAEALAMPALPAAQAAAPVMVHYTMGPDEGILQELDLAKAKPCLTRVTSFPYPQCMLWSAE